MGRYLERLRADFSEKCPPTPLTELTKAPFVGFVSTTPGRYSENAPAANDTPDPETAEVMAWLDAIGETDPATINELRALLSGDMQARDYFGERAREFCESKKGAAEFCHPLKDAGEPEDDRRICRECANLTANLSGEARCLAAWRGEIKDAGRHYHPAPDVLHRCGAFRLKHVLK